MSSGILGLCLGLSYWPLFVFLTPFVPYLMMVAICSWAVYYVARTWKDQEPPAVLFMSSQGPGEELTTRATINAFRQSHTAITETEATETKTTDGPQEHDTAFFIRAEQHFSRGAYNTAALNYRKSLEAAASIPAYLNLSTALLAVADFAGARPPLDEALRRANALSASAPTPTVDAYIAACHGNLGVIDFRQGRLQTARQHYTDAFERYKALNDHRGQADMQLNIGNTYAHQGAWEKARTAYTKALDQQRKIGSELGQAIALSNLGNAHRDNPVQALKYCHQALALHDGIDNTLGRANTLTNIGNLHFRQDELAKALGIYSKALALYQEAVSPLGEATIFGNLGNIRFKQGEPEQALEQYQNALKQHRHTGNTLGQANTLTNIGSLYLRQGKNDRAQEALQNARSLYQEAGAQSQGAAAVEKLLHRLKKKKN